MSLKKVVIGIDGDTRWELTSPRNHSYGETTTIDKKTLIIDDTSPFGSNNPGKFGSITVVGLTCQSTHETHDVMITKKTVERTYAHGDNPRCLGGDVFVDLASSEFST